MSCGPPIGLASFLKVSVNVIRGGGQCLQGKTLTKCLPYLSCFLYGGLISVCEVGSARIIPLSSMLSFYSVSGILYSVLTISKASLTRMIIQFVLCNFPFVSLCHPPSSIWSFPMVSFQQLPLRWPLASVLGAAMTRVIIPLQYCP